MGLRGWVMERGVKEMEKRGGKRENLKLGRAAVCLHLTRGRRPPPQPRFSPT
jgi:hypothetical protein